MAKPSEPKRPLRRVDPPPARRATYPAAENPAESQSPSEYAPPVAPKSDNYAAPPAEVPAPVTGVRVYHVKQGDTLWSLAKTYYGDSKHWRRILAANRNRVPDPRNLPVGIKLIIP